MNKNISVKPDWLIMKLLFSYHLIETLETMETLEHSVKLDMKRNVKKYLKYWLHVDKI